MIIIYVSMKDMATLKNFETLLFQERKKRVTIDVNMDMGYRIKPNL